MYFQAYKILWMKFTNFFQRNKAVHYMLACEMFCEELWVRFWNSAAAYFLSPTFFRVVYAASTYQQNEGSDMEKCCLLWSRLIRDASIIENLSRRCCNSWVWYHEWFFHVRNEETGGKQKKTTASAFQSWIFTENGLEIPRRFETLICHQV